MAGGLGGGGGGDRTPAGGGGGLGGGGEEGNGLGDCGLVRGLQDAEQRGTIGR